MKLNDVLKKLEIDDISDELKALWDESEKSYKNEQFYLKEDFLIHMADVIEMNSELKNAYFDTAAKIKTSPEASHFAWLLYYAYCFKRIPPKNDLPVPSRNVIGPDERMLVFIVLSPLAAELERDFGLLGVPSRYFISTMKSMDFQFKLCFDNTGSWGIWHPAWTVNYLNGGVFTIGRFVYRHRFYEGPIECVLKNVHTGKNVLLYESGAQVRKDGHINCTNGIFEENCVITSYVENDDEIVAYEAHDGAVELIPKSFKKSEWRKEFSKKDMYLEVHIPSGSSLTEDIVASSYEEAVLFYKKYMCFYPKALVCTTWLLDNDFDKLLPENSNILSFQKKYMIYPIKTSGEGVFSFMLYGDKNNPETWQQNTSFQRKMKSFLVSGGKTHENGGIILSEEIQRAYKDKIN